MTNSKYQRRAFDLIFFDCDSTLSTIEGIDELARKRGVFEEVQRLTNAAMDGEVHLESVYDHRLQLLQPTRGEIRQIERRYRDTVVADAKQLIAALHWLGKTVFVVSGGLYDAVRPFAEWLEIPTKNIRAVEVDFDQLSGDWWDFQQDRWGQRPDVDYLKHSAGPLIHSHGKAEVVTALKAQKTGRAMLVGDGMSDLAAKPAVECIVGFGGVIRRVGVVQGADVFIKNPSLSAVLPLAISPPEQSKLHNSPYADILQKGLTAIQNQQVSFRNVEWGRAISTLV